MKTIRENTFETNSSSCHAIVLLNKEQLKDFRNNHKVIWIPDTGDYCTSENVYEIMEEENAFTKYQNQVSEWNNYCKDNNREYLCEPEYENTEKGFDNWCEDLENGCLQVLNDKTGYYLNFDNFIKLINFDKDNYTFDITWWNNC